MDSYNVSTVSDAKRQNIRVGAWVSGWVRGWVAKGKCAIETQGAYKFQNQNCLSGLRVSFLLRGKHDLSTDTQLFWKVSGP